MCNSESSRRRAIERILREVGACSRADSQHREEGQAGQSWSATTESGRRRGLRARPAALCLFGRRPSLTHAHCGPVTRRCPRATGTVDRALRTLGMASRRRRRALMVLGRLDGCVWSRGGAPTGGAVIDGNLGVRMSIKLSPNPVHGGLVCVHRPWGDGGGPRGARDEHGRTPVRCSCRCSCRFRYPPSRD